MTTRRLLAYIASAIAVAIIVSVAVTANWQGKQTVFKDAPSLRELVSGGYIPANDVRASAGMDVTISPTADETSPEEILIRIRLPDGSVTALLGDGSVQGLPR